MPNKSLDNRYLNLTSVREGDDIEEEREELDKSFEGKHNMIFGFWNSMGLDYELDYDKLPVISNIWDKYIYGRKLNSTNNMNVVRVGEKVNLTSGHKRQQFAIKIIKKQINETLD